MPLRILHTVHDYLPVHQAGSELYVGALCAALTAAGHHPAVFAAEFSPRDPHGSLRWRTHAGVPVIEVVNNWQGSTFATTYDADAIQTAFTHALDAVRPDVVHVHNLLNLSLSLPRLARARGIAVVATLHDHTLACPSGGQRVHKADAHVCRTIDPERCARCFAETPFYRQWQFGQVARHVPAGLAGRTASAVARRLPWAARAGKAALAASPGPAVTAGDIVIRLETAKRTFSEFQAAVAPSQSLADEYRRLGFPADRLETSDYGFAPLEVRPRTPNPRGRLRLGFTGTLVWHKGVDLLIDAARRLPADHIEVHIFGDETVFPDYTRDLRQRADGLPVSFRGAYAHHDIPKVLSEIDVLVVPSRWLENSPLVIHEAFMTRVPVVAAAIGGMPDLLDHGRHGVLFEPDSADALAHALRTLLDNPARLAELTAQAPPVKTIGEDAVEWMARYRAAVREATGMVAVS
jgi:glycosyltransferase involved in cell wall biosynthesis